MAHVVGLRHRFDAPSIVQAIFSLGHIDVRDIRDDVPDANFQHVGERERGDPRDRDVLFLNLNSSQNQRVIDLLKF